MFMGDIKYILEDRYDTCRGHGNECSHAVYMYDIDPWERFDMIREERMATNVAIPSSRKISI